MNYLVLTIGSVVALIGIGIFILTVVLLRENRVKNIFTGVVFVLLGSPFIFLGIKGQNSLNVNFGVSNQQIGIIFVCFVFGLFILKGVLDIRAGLKALHDKTIPSTQLFMARLRIVIAIIITTFSVIFLIVTFTQSGK